MIKLNVFKQSRGYCGPACLKMVFGYYGIIKSERKLAELTKTTRDHGCWEDEMIKVAAKLGLQGYYKEKSSIKEVRQLVKSGIPVIVDWFSPEEGGHYSVVVGFTKNKIRIADPHFGEIKEHTIEWFADRWFDCPFRKKGVIIREIIVIKKQIK